MAETNKTHNKICSVKRSTLLDPIIVPTIVFIITMILLWIPAFIRRDEIVTTTPIPTTANFSTTPADILAGNPHNGSNCEYYGLDVDQRTNLFIP